MVNVLHVIASDDVSDSSLIGNVSTRMRVTSTPMRQVPESAVRNRKSSEAADDPSRLRKRRSESAGAQPRSDKRARLNAISSASQLAAGERRSLVQSRLDDAPRPAVQTHATSDAADEADEAEGRSNPTFHSIDFEPATSLVSPERSLAVQRRTSASSFVLNPVTANNGAVTERSPRSVGSLLLPASQKEASLRRGRVAQRTGPPASPGRRVSGRPPAAKLTLAQKVERNSKGNKADSKRRSGEGNHASPSSSSVLKSITHQSRSRSRSKEHSSRSNRISKRFSTSLNNQSSTSSGEEACSAGRLSGRSTGRTHSVSPRTLSRRRSQTNSASPRKTGRNSSPHRLFEETTTSRNAAGGFQRVRIWPGKEGERRLSDLCPADVIIQTIDDVAESFVDRVTNSTVRRALKVWQRRLTEDLGEELEERSLRRTDSLRLKREELKMKKMRDKICSLRRQHASLQRQKNLEAEDVEKEDTRDNQHLEVSRPGDE